MKNVAYTQVGSVVICYYNADAPTDRDHRESIEFFRTLDFKYVKVLAITEGGSPSTIQRKEFNEALKGHEIPLAVVTDSRLVRGTLTAYGWFNRNIRAFSWADFLDALTYLKVQEKNYEKFLGEVQKLQDQVRGKGSLPELRPSAAEPRSGAGYRSSPPEPRSSPGVRSSPPAPPSSSGSPPARTHLTPSAPSSRRPKP
ncbi:MAG: hypothetical protein QM820_31020 [Minicystis sp.]